MRRSGTRRECNTPSGVVAAKASLATREKKRERERGKREKTAGRIDDTAIVAGGGGKSVLLQDTLA